MHSLPYEINCTECGCPDVDVERPPRPGEWFASGQARCNECGAPFSFRAPEPGDGPDAAGGRKAEGGSVAYRPVKCPECGSLDVPVQRTALPVRYHQCRACGANFKSVEKR
jgi:transcription elongation factor Elf1